LEDSKSLAEKVWEGQLFIDSDWALYPYSYLLSIFWLHASGNLVEPMSVWSASECFMLIIVLSTSRRLIQVLVDDVHFQVFVLICIVDKMYKFLPRTQREASAGFLM
jgi:hypothetical protein